MHARTHARSTHHCGLHSAGQSCLGHRCGARQHESGAPHTIQKQPPCLPLSRHSLAAELQHAPAAQLLPVLSSTGPLPALTQHWQLPSGRTGHVCCKPLGWRLPA
eukprot:1157707-Pelagomonas_calceolata.AAC.5